MFLSRIAVAEKCALDALQVRHIWKGVSQVRRHVLFALS